MLHSHHRRPPRNGRLRLVRLMLAVACSVAGVAGLGVAGLGVVGAGSADAAAGSTLRQSVVARAESLPLPRLGTSQVVETDDVGDPFILPIPKGIPGDRSARYVLFWTTDWRSNVPTAVSSDMVHWRRVADSLPVLPSWATPSRTMTWGPAAMAVKGGWVLYFSTQEASSHRQCIGAAFSSNPVGPYVDSSPAPLVCQLSLGGSIDPSVVSDAPGGPVLVWKDDGNAGHHPVGIWEQRLAAGGRSLVGRDHRLLQADEHWQHGIIEGPAMVAAHEGGWWLFYSGGSWQSDTYATGVAWCATISGPCANTSARPFLAGLPKAVSPGGLDTFVDSAGRLWASYSAFPSTPANEQEAMAENRVLEIAPVTLR